jgi:single stranded DNA-binding protein
VAWGKLGELAATYLAKGRKVMVVGRLQTQSWEKDGVKRSRTEIVASDVNFLDAPGTPGAPGAGQAGSFGLTNGGGNSAPKSDDVVIQDLDSNQNINLDDIPF